MMVAEKIEIPEVVVDSLLVNNLLLLMLGLLLTTKKGPAYRALVIIPGAMAPILLITINALKAVKKEKAARGVV